jgi:hypothetical protein
VTNTVLPSMFIAMAPLDPSVDLRRFRQRLFQLFKRK